MLMYIDDKSKNNKVWPAPLPHSPPPTALPDFSSFSLHLTLKCLQILFSYS